jgi:hypothetical protein
MHATPIQASASAGVPAPKFARSRQMIDCLRASFLYTEKRARDILFREIEAVLRSAPKPVQISRLIRTAAARAARRADTPSDAAPNWNIASRATVHAMLAASVLLRKDGSPIPRTPDATHAEAAALRPNFPDLTEGALLEFLIRKLGDVTPRDHTALAHVLFRQFDASVPLEQLQARVTSLLAALSHRIVLTESGEYFTYV